MTVGLTKLVHGPIRGFCQSDCGPTADEKYLNRYTSANWTFEPGRIARGCIIDSRELRLDNCKSCEECSVAGIIVPLPSLAVCMQSYFY